MTNQQWERFRVKVSVDDDESGCWLWTGAITRNGYGNFTLDPRRGHYKFRVAHRVSYEHFTGPIPAGAQLDHLCRVRHCVNPKHLEPVSNRENSQRGLRGRMVTHCARGHEYTPENTYWRKEGRRMCRSCNRERSAERRAGNAGRGD